MHDLVSRDPFRRDASRLPMLVSTVLDLSSNLIKMQMADSRHPPIEDLDANVRQAVARLMEFRSASPAELELKAHALDLLEDVLGTQSDCHRALAQDLGRPMSGDSDQFETEGRHFVL